ncbi:hypothetical protein [Helicobacter mehlei]|uniref:Ferrochelatase n=1 Tax=Helicobacter mehlei TaxID=2316080 RepID=A0A553USP4_9HELI|nr:hypothetical protein [Helicobacter mehlei]TSA83220.1 hypothetical protein FNE76_05220 [Helicobacter mehlei]
MDVHEVVAITRGVLKSRPYVHKFTHTTHKASQVRQGSLFVALDIGGIDLALSLGAYGILYDQEVPISDTEVAWIYVPNLDMAVEKLLYYKLLEAPAIFGVCAVEFAILQKIAPEELLFFEGSKLDLLDFNLSAPCVILQDTLQSHLFKPKDIPLEPMPFEVLLPELFSMSICYQRQRYDLKLSSFYVPQLAKALHICTLASIQVHLDRLGVLNFMQPHYTNPQLEPCAFGQSLQILILEKQSEQIVKMARYAHKITPWQQIQIFTPKPLSAPHVLYGDLAHLRQILQITPYTLGFIGGDFAIQQILKPKKSPKGLFDGL